MKTLRRDISNLQIPNGVEVFEIYGSLFFGAVSQFKESIRVVADKPKVLILRMRNVSTIDASGIHILEELIRETSENGCVLIFSAVAPNVFKAMKKSGFIESVGKENFAKDIHKALEIADNYLIDNSRFGK